MKVITVEKIVLFVIRCRSIRGEVDFFSNLIKRIREIADIMRRTKNILILTGELIVVSFLSLNTIEQ